MTRIKLFLIVLLLTVTNVLLAQTSITGTVYDDISPLPRASVIIKGTSKGTETDFDGNFRIDNLDTGNVILQISFVGYEIKEIPLTIQSGQIQNVGKIILKNSSEQLNEVVVTALGIKRATKKLGYSVQELKGDEISKAKETNVVNSLSGKFSGVQVTGGNSGVGSTSIISIRGEGSLIPGQNTPLFVVDGIPIRNATSSNEAEGNMETDYGNGAQDINPDDIESISVLKGPNATALYGSRGANGVILITTKSGQKSKGLGISYTNNTTFETLLTMPKWQNQYGQGKKGAFSFGNGGFESDYNKGTNDGVDESWGPKLDGRLIPQYDSPTSSGLRAGDVAIRPRDVDGNYTDAVIPTPWSSQPNNIRDFFRAGYTISHNLAITGVNEKGNLRLSLTDLQSEGISPNTDYNRRTYALSGGYQLTDWLKVSSSMNYINSNSSNRPNNSYGTENIMYLWVWFGRQINMNSLKKYWQPGFEGVQQFNYNYNWHDNPYFTLNENTNAFDKDRLIGNFRADINLTKELSLMLRTGIDFSNDLRIGKRAFSTQRFARGQYREDNVYNKEQNTDFLFTFNKNLNSNFTIGASFGGNLRISENKYKRTSANSLSVPGVYNFQNANEPLSKTQYNDKKQVQSLYAFANLAYKNYLFLDVTGRNDWSSTLPSYNNSYFYPSVGLSAIISDMFEMPTFISFAKLRAGWAVVGNDTQPYNLISTYSFREAFNGMPRVAAYKILKNENLKPEKTNSIEFGADIRLLKNRIGFDVAVYKSIVRDQILTLPTTITSGLKARIINAGEVENKGLEVTLNLKPIKTENFQWDLNTNFTTNEGIVRELTSGIDTYQIAENNGVQVLAKVGGKVGDMYGSGFKMIDGKILHDKGLPVVDNTLVKLGNYNPDFMMGFQNSFKYKNIDFSFLFDWRNGGVFHSRTVAIGGTTGMLDFTTVGRETGVVGEGVMADGKGGYIKNNIKKPASEYYSNYYERDNEVVSVFDASYVKLREVKLSYNFPKSMLEKSFIRSASVSIIGRNLVLWTENKHVDPETISFDGGTIIPGLEDMALPSTRSYGFSFNVQF